MKANIIFKGGPGSGNFGHAGRPGKRGGSASGGGRGGGGASKKRKNITASQIGDSGAWDSYGYTRKGVPASIKNTISYRKKKAIDEAIANNKGRVFTLGDSYFYRHNRSPESHESEVIESFKGTGFKVTPVASGDHWAAFHGGANPMSKKDSFFWTVAVVDRE